jgi:hypothetical protein
MKKILSFIVTAMAFIVVVAGCRSHTNSDRQARREKQLAKQSGFFNTSPPPLEKPGQ